MQKSNWDPLPSEGSFLFALQIRFITSPNIKEGKK